MHRAMESESEAGVEKRTETTAQEIDEHKKQRNVLYRGGRGRGPENAGCRPGACWGIVQVCWDPAGEKQLYRNIYVVFEWRNEPAIAKRSETTTQAIAKHK